jgi:alpha-beta hydrolase superfamily lysophospholipase
MTALPLVRTFTDNEGIDITFYEWPVAKSKGVVQLVHGLGEHARRYDHVAAAFNRAGYSVYADDHRGHGQTGVNMRASGAIKRQGQLGAGGMNAVFADVRQLSHIISGEHPEEPLILFGHSWGSLISQRIWNKYSDEFDGLILSGSTIALPGIMPSSGFNKRWQNTVGASGHEWLSRDHEVGHEFRVDPLNFPESALEVFGVANAARLLGTPSKNIDAHVPILLIAGSEDALGGERGNRMLANAYKKVGVEDLNVIIYHGGRHEMVNETNKDEVLADLVGWLEERFG